VEKTFLFDGFIEHFEKLIPQESKEFPLILAHNDAQENNILMNIKDNRSLMLIDYEYAGWNPMAMDLSNYINETILENAYPLGNGINWYLDNCMELPEIEQMVKKYMECYYKKYMLPEVKAAFASADDFIT